MGNDRHREIPVRNRCHSETDPIDADGTFFHDQIQDLFCTCDRNPDCVFFASHGLDLPGSIDVSGHEMAAESSVRCHRPLQVYITSILQGSKAAPPHGLRHHIRGKSAVFQICDRQADAVYCNAVPDLRSFQDFFRPDCQRSRSPTQGKCLYLTEFFHDSRKHFFTSSPVFRTSPHRYRSDRSVSILCPNVL